MSREIKEMAESKYPTYFAGGDISLLQQSAYMSGFIECIIKHGFPNGMHENNPVYIMKSPEIDYVLNKGLTKILKEIHELE